jgi:hypothetical protein
MTCRKILGVGATLLSAGFLAAGCAAPSSGPANALARPDAPAVSKACASAEGTAVADLRAVGDKPPTSSPQALYNYIESDVLPHWKGSAAERLEVLAQNIRIQCHVK